MYQQASAGQQKEGAGAESGGHGSSADEDVVDADFEEVKEDEKK
jgi:molecular chaperone DnaK